MVQQSQASEDTKAAATQPDLTKYVPKEDYDKLSGSVKDLETKLDEAKMSLLDPEYISYLESKKAKSSAKEVSKSFEFSDKDLDSLSSKQLLELAVDKAKASIISELNPKLEEVFKRYDMSLSDLYAVIELQDVEKRFKDFSEYRSRTKEILESSKTPLTIEQAYKLAKQEAIEKDPSKAQPREEAKPVKGTERPGGAAPASLQTKTFKNKAEAGDDAWEGVVGAGKDYL